MTDQLWSWALSIVGLAGLFLAGKKIWWAWYLNIAGQALWFAYAIVTEQYGFLVAAFGYTFVFAKNAIAWTKEHFDENEGWDFNEYSHLQEQFSSDRPALDSFDVNIPEVHKRPTHSFYVDFLEFDSAEEIERFVTAEREQWLSTLPNSPKLREIVSYIDHNTIEPGIRKVTLEAVYDE